MHVFLDFELQSEDKQVSLFLGMSIKYHKLNSSTKRDDLENSKQVFGDLVTFEPRHLVQGPGFESCWVNPARKVLRYLMILKN